MVVIVVWLFFGLVLFVGEFVMLICCLWLRMFWFEVDVFVFVGLFDLVMV